MGLLLHLRLWGRGGEERQPNKIRLPLSEESPLPVWLVQTVPEVRSLAECPGPGPLLTPFYLRPLDMGLGMCGGRAGPSLCVLFATWARELATQGGEG
jgi:hypothetical protein